MILNSDFDDGKARTLEMEYDSWYSIRQCHRPFWGNIRTMKSILETTEMMCGDGFDFIDMYDLLTFKKDSATVTFDYDGKDWQILIFRNGAEIVYSFEDRWFHAQKIFL